MKQKELFDTFLSHHAISQAQYDKSLGDLREKPCLGGHEMIDFLKWVLKGLFILACSVLLVHLLSTAIFFLF